jgi:hypothetical protein
MGANMKHIRIILICVLLLLLIVETVYAMGSANYRIDWNNLLTGSGGKTQSLNYLASYTVGQTASQTSESGNYQTQLGYWAGVQFSNPIFALFLPRIVRSP